MFCEHCGSRLEENAIFCTNCGKSATGEATPSAEAKNLVMSEWSRELHQEYFWEYFGKGLIGFGIGAVFAVADGFPAAILYLGLAFAGVPYGWNLITRITGGWTLYGSVVIVLLFYILKLFFSLLIGVTVYPPLLFYHLMMSQKPKSAAQSVCVIIFILSIIASVLVISGFVAKG